MSFKTSNKPQHLKARRRFPGCWSSRVFGSRCCRQHSMSRDAEVIKDQPLLVAWNDAVPLISTTGHTTACSGHAESSSRFRKERLTCSLIFSGLFLSQRKGSNLNNKIFHRVTLDLHYSVMTCHHFSSSFSLLCFELLFQRTPWTHSLPLGTKWHLWTPKPCRAFPRSRQGTVFQLVPFHLPHENTPPPHTL